MNHNVTIIDYGISNLLSVVRAFEHIGATVTIAESPEDIRQANHLVLPGVGAFADGMKGLTERNLIGAIKEHAAEDKPFLGICVGMQLMLDIGEEFGEHTGLGLIPGRVTAIPNTTEQNQPHKIPHIGWNQLLMPSTIHSWERSILANTNIEDAVYFVHSFMAEPHDPSHRFADVLYNGRKISAVIKKDSLYGCQFHPEKSGQVGLNILEQFLKL